MKNINIGFIGAGGIARAHAYALNSLKYYYDDPPDISFHTVTSSRKESRENFAAKYGFHKACNIEELVADDEVNAVYILGPNNVHFEHFRLAYKMPSVKYIYLEKPVCATEDEEKQLNWLIKSSAPIKKIQVGFQYLQTASVREALKFWKSGKLGKAIHFNLQYYHGDYLQESYRAKRKTRLTPAPDGGAMADLGSHGISLLMAFMGEELEITGALQGGAYKDVPEGSDLFSSISLVHPGTKAVGTLSASRVSSGTGDHIKLEIFAEKGTLQYSSYNPEHFEYYLEETQEWSKKVVGSRYEPITSFPSGHVPPGWLRSMVHAHYVFLTENDKDTFIPDLKHGLAVQRIVRETAKHLKNFRSGWIND